MVCSAAGSMRNGMGGNEGTIPAANRFRSESNDSSSFAPYTTAVQASGYDGIGIGIFNGICAIDLDNCVRTAAITHRPPQKLWP